MKNKYYGSLIISFLFFSALSAQIKTNNEITADELKAHISYLASDSLEGRFTGSKGADLASEYIAQIFSEINLKPLFDNSYFQNFPFVSGLKLSENNYAKIHTNDKDYSLKINEEFSPTPFTGNAFFKGQIVFAGYGISEPKLNYDDYKDIDVKGKAVLILRYNPEGDNPHSDFEQYSAYRYKAKTAKEKGASAVIFVTGFYPKDDVDKLMELRYDGAAGIDSLPIIQIKRNIAAELFESNKLNLSEIQKQINENKKPNSFLLQNIQFEINTAVEQIIEYGKNVAGYIEGNDSNLKNEYIVLGAHYDHLGYGQVGSLYRGSEKKIHNGADDNASGTSGVIELAENFSSIKNNLKRSIIFICFAGEEEGLLGSSYFVNHSPIELEKIVSMINMDMIGRLTDENKLIVYGTGTSSNWKDYLNQANNNYSFKLTFNDEGYGPSDHSSFYSAKIPVLFFFTGTHTDYHRPSDDIDKINFKGEEKLLKFVEDVLYVIDTLSKRPDYIDVPRKQSEGRMRFRVYVGTIPDYSSQVEGLKITGVSNDSPAQKAGLQAGDIIIKFGEKKISNIYDYTYALGDYSPGDIVEIVVIRQGEKLKLNIELGAR